MAEQQIDENLYSRQLLTFGEEAMKKMTNSSVLVSGLSGLGLEVLKCIILAGAKNVVVHDFVNKVHTFDLSSMYYLKMEHVGQTKIDKVLPHLKSLNPNVKVTGSDDLLTNEFLSDFDVVVMCDYNLFDLFSHSRYCHENNIKFIMANSHGLYGYVFCDFGAEFSVSDMTGEEIKSGVLVGVNDKTVKNSKGEEEVIKNVMVSMEPHGLDTGSFVKIRRNGKFLKKDYEVETVLDTNHFTLKKGPYKKKQKLSKVEFEQVKRPTAVNFKPLQEAITDPSFVFTNSCDFTRHITLHAFTRAMWMMYSARRFENQHNPQKDRLAFFPRIWNEEDAQTLTKFCKAFFADANEKVIRKLSYIVTGKICPNDSVIGSLAAQEVMKACSGKYTPINQWMYIDHLTAFRSDVELPYTGPIENFNPNGTRDDGQIVVFGRDLVEEIKKGKVFIVGSGAIGCEHMKNFCMMGVGNIVNTDMDHIEMSNLNRQFLFRPEDIGKPKSVTAGVKGKLMNPDVNIESHEYKVGEETLNIYNQEFFDSLTCVANALDNVGARKFVDTLCVNSGKFLLESGTLGTKCNVQVIVPGLSESYGSTADPEEKSIPMCTLKLFPYKIEHVVQYARNMMDEYFTVIPNNYNLVLNDWESVKDKSRTELLGIYSSVKTVKDAGIKKYKHCVKLAFDVWHKNYRDNVKNLTDKFPQDSTNKDGSPFWSGEKRFPTFTEFNTKNKNHMGFVINMAHILADVFGIAQEDRVDVSNTKKHKKIIKGLDVPEMVTMEIKVKEKKEGEDNEEEEEQNEGDGTIEDEELKDISKADMLKKLKKMVKKPYTVQAIEFEKDDDSNHHIDFITCAANMRATNYGIATEDRLSIKKIAGKIIPAIATTTSLASGLVGIELYKVFQGKDKLEDYADSFCNMAITRYEQSEPKPVKTSVVNGQKYNIWTCYEADHDMTLRELVEEFEDSVYTHEKMGNLGLEFSFVMYGDEMIYQSFMPDEKELDKTLGKIIKTRNKSHGKSEILLVSADPPDDFTVDDFEPVEGKKRISRKLAEKLIDFIFIEPLAVRVKME